MNNNCKICGNTEKNKLHTIREMHFGLKEEFQYLECNSCGCLQLLDIPSDLSVYYPTNYYSFNNHNPKSKWKKLREKYKVQYWMNHSSIWGRILSFRKEKLNFLKWFENIDINYTTSILDVGCGSGKLLRQMSDVGFTNLTGVDPFLTEDLSYNNVNIYKKDIFQLDSLKFNVIMLNHSFEHMNNPDIILYKLYSLLEFNGSLFIRIPIASSYAWKHYGINWVQLDAPRHIFLHTINSMKILAEKSGFHIKSILYDSNEGQFTGSELYKKGISLIDERAPTFFNKADVKKYRKYAIKLNEERQGDQACFCLQKEI